MNNKWIPFLAVFFMIALALYWPKKKMPRMAARSTASLMQQADEMIWIAPDSGTIPQGDSGVLIRYGKQLIQHTSLFLGPRGSVSHLINGMNCENCHLDAGTKPWAGNFGSVASLFPRFSDRRGSVETVNQRITDCFERSMNGKAPDSSSREMRAMNAYILWVGKDVLKGKKPKGTGIEQLSYLNRAADSVKGRALYEIKCASCHGRNGEGLETASAEYRYPPLWGNGSYNTAAGLYRLSKFAGFIKDNMPYGSDYKNEHLTNEEAWDLAAYINSQPRPIRKFRRDWPDIESKPVDISEGPFPDTYSSLQHKFGPFPPIAKYRKEYTAGIHK